MRACPRRIALTAVLVMCGATLGEAAPTGRDWTPIQRFAYGGHDYIIPSRFEPTLGNRLEVIAQGYYGPNHHRVYGFVWRDTTWSPRWHMDREAYVIWPCYTDSGVQMMVWRDVVERPPGVRSHWLITADVQGDTVTPSDTVAAIDVFANQHCGAERAGMRWITTMEFDVIPLQSQLRTRVFAKRSTGDWKELPSPLGSVSRLDNNTQVIALSDSTAMVVYAGGKNLGWGVVNDTGWVRAPEHLQEDYATDMAYVRPSPDGTIWLSYGRHDSVSYVRRFRDGQWTEPDTMRWAFPTTDWHLTYVGAMSLDDRERPTLSGFAYSTSGALEFIYVNVPTQDGYLRFERIPHSDGGLTPSVARDENGDVWLAWWKFLDGMFWIHSYTRATCSTPTLSERAGRPHLEWSLSEPAPGSVWSVLRSLDGNPEDEVARLTAPQVGGLSWTDSGVPAGARARYRIRRECRDVRYQWLSEASEEWQPRSALLVVTLRSANPVSGALEADITGAGAGTLSLVLYDLQGREVAREVKAARGTGRDPVRFSPGPGTRPGLYLLLAQSDGGARSSATKVVLLR